MPKKRPTAAQKQRVVTLMNAISDLCRGDLHAVLDLDAVMPLEEFPPDPKSLISRVQTGKHFARILEHHLESVMVFGEVALPASQKMTRKKDQIGGLGF